MSVYNKLIELRDSFDRRGMAKDSFEYELVEHAISSFGPSAKKLDKMLKKELIDEVLKSRDKARAYDRVCQQLGINGNILGYINNLRKTDDALSQERIWYTAYFCVNCHRELTSNQQYDISGKCTLCGYKDKHAFVMVKSYGKAYFLKEINPFYMFWKTRYIRVFDEDK